MYDWICFNCCWRGIKNIKTIFVDYVGSSEKNDLSLMFICRHFGVFHVLFTAFTVIFTKYSRIRMRHCNRNMCLELVARLHQYVKIF